MKDRKQNRNPDNLYGLKQNLLGLSKDEIPGTVVKDKPDNTVNQSSIVAAKYYDNNGNQLFIFKNIVSDNGSTIVADSLIDTLNLTSSDSSITITNTSTTDTIDFVVDDSKIDHGTLGGLTDNDHTQYVNAVSDTSTLNLTLTGQSISGTIIAGGVDHNNLTGLQGGQANEYYHLTAAQHADVIKLPWTRDTVNGYTYLNNLTDKVGIGTDTPTVKLEILSTTQPQLKISYDATNYLAFNKGTNRGSIDINKIRAIIIEDNGDVGFSIIPTAKLHVAGDSLFQNPVDAINSYSWLDSAGASILSLDSVNKYVGINQTVPTEKLEVNGNIFLTTDSDKMLFGTGKDMSIYYDGTNGVIDTQEVGSGYLSILSQVGIDVAASAALTLPAGTAAAGTAPLKFTSGTALTTPEAGTLEYDGCRLCVTNVATCRAIDRTSDVLLETVTVANTTTKTLLWTGVMPANSLCAGNIFKFEGIGEGSNTANGILTISVEVGGNEVVTVSNTVRNFTDDDIHISAVATQRTIGATGSRAFHFHLEIGEDTSVVDGVATINTTNAMDVEIYATWSAARASNTMSLYQGFMEYKN